MAQQQGAQYHTFGAGSGAGAHNQHVVTPQGFPDPPADSNNYYIDMNGLASDMPTGLQYDDGLSYAPTAFYNDGGHPAFEYQPQPQAQPQAQQPLDAASSGPGYNTFPQTFPSNHNGEYPAPPAQAQYHDAYSTAIYGQGQHGSLQQYSGHSHPHGGYQVSPQQDGQFFIQEQEFHPQQPAQQRQPQQLQQVQQTQHLSQPQPQPQQRQQLQQSPKQQQGQLHQQPQQLAFQSSANPQSYGYSSGLAANNLPQEHMQTTAAQFAPSAVVASRSPAPAPSPSPAQFRRPSPAAAAATAAAPNGAFVISTFQPPATANAPQPSAFPTEQSWQSSESPILTSAAQPQVHTFSVAPSPSPGPAAARQVSRAPAPRQTIASRPNAAAIPAASRTPAANPAATRPLAAQKPAVTVSQSQYAPPSAAQYASGPSAAVQPLAPKPSTSLPPSTQPLPRPKSASHPSSSVIPMRDPAVAQIAGPRLSWPGVSGVVLGGTVSLPASTTPEPLVLLDPEKRLGLEVMGRDDPLPGELMRQFTKANEGLTNESNIDGKLKGLETILQKDYSLGLPAGVKAELRTILLRDDDLPDRSKLRPADPADAAAWDAIGVVFIKARQRGDSSIKHAVKGFGDLIKGFSEKIKRAKAELEAAESQAGISQAEKDRLKDALALEQKLMYRAIDAAYEKGDEQVLENLGSNRPLVANLVASIRDCHNAGDFSGAFPKAILRLMALFISLPEDLLIQRLKFDKIQKRFMSKGDDEIKRLFNEVTTIIKSGKDSNNSDGKAHGKKTPSDAASAAASSPGASGSVPMKKVSSSSGVLAKGTKTARVPSDSSPAKRPRDDDSDTPVAKKFAANPAAGASQPVVSKVSGPSVGTIGKVFAPSALLPGKSRPVPKPVSRQEPAKSDLAKTQPVRTESPKPSSDKAEIAKSEPAKLKKVVLAKSEPAQSSVSRLGSLLDEIAQPKKALQPTAKMSIDPVEINETAEEKEKRLRKEKRRKLRVTWKEGDALTEVRVFHKHVDEDEGRAVNMIRHATDDRSEGMMLKKGFQKGLDLDKDDDDDDDDAVIPDRPWQEPSVLNLSSLLENKRTTNFVSRGGYKPISTVEKEIMEERQKNELMEVYIQPSDIPPTPKSPTASTAEPVAQPGQVIEGLPSNTPRLDEIQARWRESEQIGVTQALHGALMRLRQRDMGAHSSGYAGRANHSAHPSAKALALLQSDVVKRWSDDSSRPETQRRFDYPDPAVQQATDTMEEISETLKGKPFPPTEPPSYISDADRVREWWQGFNREKERRAQAAEQEKLRREAEARQAAQAQVAAAPAPAAQSQSQPSPEEQAVAWNAYYAQLGQAYGQDPAQTQALAAAAAQQQQQQSQYAQYAQYAQYYQQQQQQGSAAAAQPGADAANANPQLQALLSALGGVGTPAVTAPTIPAAPATAAAATNPQAALANAQLQALLASATGQPAAGLADPAQQAYMAQLAQWAAAQQQQQGQSVSGQDSGGNPNAMDVTWGSGPRANGNDHHDRGDRGIGGGVRDRDRDRDHGYGGHHQKQHGKEGGFNRREKRSNINRDLIGTKPCMFWASGKCAKGDKCTFRHE